MSRTADIDSTRTQPRRGGKLSYQQFLAEGGDAHMEWVDGEVVEMPPVSDEHSKLCLYLARLLGDWLEDHPIGELLGEPFNMKTGPDLPGRSPDLMFVASGNAARVRRNHLAGPADLVIEVVSPESRGRDRGDKYREYEAGGVGEYWILDPELLTADFHVLGDTGSYDRVVPQHDIYRSRALPGFWLDVRWLWQRPQLKDVRRWWEAGHEETP